MTMKMFFLFAELWRGLIAHEFLEPHLREHWSENILSSTQQMNCKFHKTDAVSWKIYLSVLKTVFNMKWIGINNTPFKLLNNIGQNFSVIWPLLTLMKIFINIKVKFLLIMSIGHTKTWIISLSINIYRLLG